MREVQMQMGSSSLTMPLLHMLHQSIMLQHHMLHLSTMLRPSTMPHLSTMRLFTRNLLVLTSMSME